MVKKKDGEKLVCGKIGKSSKLLAYAGCMSVVFINNAARKISGVIGEKHDGLTSLQQPKYR